MSEQSFEYSYLVGKIIANDYKIEKTLGVGGMGAVFCAKQLSTNLDIALKVILPENTADPTIVQRFLREAKAGLLLSHPNIVKTYKYSRTSDGLLFIVMEYVNGATLQNYLQESNKFSLQKISNFLYQLAGALDTAHKHNVLHRDLKPENILVTKTMEGEEILKLTDFGIAKIISPQEKTNTRLTGTGQIIGTPKYMSPEQLLGLTIKHTTDIYSLGLIIYRMLAGATPSEFEGKTGTIFKVTQDLPPISQKFSFLPSDFDQVFQKVLVRDPSVRYQSAGAFYKDFAQIVAKYPNLVIANVDSTEKEDLSLTLEATLLQNKGN